MFVHPSTSHFSRTQHGLHNNPIQTTSRKNRNVNKENANSGLPSKTPSRAGLGKAPGTSIRVGLGVKSAAVTKDGNVQGGRVDPPGEKGKGGGNDGHDIEPKRLFASTSKPQTSLKPSTSTQGLGTTPALNKSHRTPGPRRNVQTFSTLRTPAPGPSSFVSPTGQRSTLQQSGIRPTSTHKSKHPSPGPTPLPSGKQRRVSKSAQPSPGPTPLPSATRTRRRSRQSLTPAEPEFQTPGQRWEEEPSLGSITGGLDGLELGTLGGVEEVDEESDDDELEYMPPPMEEPPFRPAYDLPDVTKAFGTLSKLPPLWVPSDPDAGVPTLDQELVLEPAPTENLRLADDESLEEPMFRAEKSVPVTAVKPAEPVKVVRLDPRPTALGGTKRPMTLLKPPTGARASQTLMRRPGFQSSTAAPQRAGVSRSIRPPAPVSRVPASGSRPLTKARTAPTVHRVQAKSDGPAKAETSPAPVDELDIPLDMQEMVLGDDAIGFDLSAFGEERDD